MSYLYFKSLHLIFVITWFCGLFYSVRLLIYHAEASQKSANEKLILTNQFKIMERRLWFGITWPSSILTFIFGFLMVPSWLPLLNNTWLILKLFLVFLLFLYHLSVGVLIRNFKNDQINFTSNQLRLWNEVPTLFLFAIVFLVILKSNMNALQGFLAVLLLGVVLFVAIKIYKRLRSKNG
jgi:putative membrane protein